MQVFFALTEGARRATGVSANAVISNIPNFPLIFKSLVILLFCINLGGIY